ncbi:MAG: DHA2 family efflux MFS transporter permease subunit [Bacteroidetes bacterium]|jgi:DHA2 family multidrug resistance protein|nr:DHA2 family efflux MFS transporter permease subunit [Bacteroidota bacterium]
MYPTGLKRAMIVFTTISAAIMELIDTSIVNVALSQISGNLGATIEDTSWVVTAYAIANVIIIPMTGFLQRYFGRKNYYLTSIFIFTIASYMCGNADSLWSLVAWRFIQGIGGGALLSTSQGILFDAFEPKKRAMASGIFGMGIVLGPTIGPTLGGLIVDNYSWPLIFYINIPFGILAAMLTLFFIDKKEDELNIDRKTISIDYFGIAMLVMGVGCLQYVLEKGQSEDWFESEYIRILSPLCVIGIGTFIWRQLHVPNPIINLKVLKNTNLAASNVLTFVCGFGLFGSVFIFPVLVQRIMGYSPTEAGFAIVPGTIIGLFLMPIIGKTLGSGTPPIVYVVIGFIAFIFHGYTSSLATAEASRAWFIFPQMLRGIGTACLTVPLINQAVVGLAPKDMPSGIALTNMLRQLGGAFGIAMMNTFVTQRFAVHRSDLITNTAANDPEMMQRLSSITQVFLSKGFSAADAQFAAFKAIDGAVTKQAYLLSYLDSYLIISLFFLITIPFLFLLRTKKVDATTLAKVAEESH